MSQEPYHEVLLNSDLLTMITNNFSPFSEMDRISLAEALNNLPDYPGVDKNTLIKTVIKYRLDDIKNYYDSFVVTNTINLHPIANSPLTYWFCTVYPKSENIPECNEYYIADTFVYKKPWDQSRILTSGIVWNLTGLAGKIVSGATKMLFYSNDTRSIHVKSYRYNLLVKEEWYRDGRLHRDNGPALIQYYFGRNTIEEYWYDGHQYPSSNVIS